MYLVKSATCLTVYGHQASHKRGNKYTVKFRIEVSMLNIRIVYTTCISSWIALGTEIVNVLDV